MRSKPEKRGTVDANMVFEMMKNAIVNCVKGCLRRVMFNKNFIYFVSFIASTILKEQPLC